jgi:WD40 repeat protein
LRARVRASAWASSAPEGPTRRERSACVEVAHEALLREWPRLRGWLDDDAQGRRLHGHLRTAAQEWHAGGRDPGELYRGARLAAALDWATDHDPELNATERGFLDASRAASGRARRRVRMVLAGVACLLVLAVIAALVALDERGNARHQATAADAERLGAQALAQNDLDRSLLLARQGVALHDSLQTRGNLLAALLKSPAADGVIRGEGARLTGLDLSPDGRTLAVTDDSGTLSLIDTRTRRPLARRRTVPDGVVVVRSGGLDTLRFSDDGSLLAVGGQEPVILDARTLRVRTHLLVGSYVLRLRFSHDGQTLFAALDDPVNRGTAIRRFDARNGQSLGRVLGLTRRAAVIPALLLTSDDQRLVTSVNDGPTVIRDARTLRPLKRLGVGAGEAALSPNDHTLLLGGPDGSVRFLDLVTGRLLIGSGRHNGAITGAAFSGDGRTAITASVDGRAIVWNVGHAVPRETLEGHAGGITGVAISADGHTAYTASLDGTALIWDLAGTHGLGRRFDVGPGRAVVAVSPDGRVLAAGHEDGTVTLIDTHTLKAISTFIVAHGPVRGLGYMPHGRLLVVGGDHGSLALVDPTRGELVKRLRGHTGTLLTPSFSADGRLMATVDFPGGSGTHVVFVSGLHTKVSLWTLPSGERIRREIYENHPQPDMTVALSPDGRTLAIGIPGTDVDIYDTTTRHRRNRLPNTETLGSLRFTPDGRFLIGGSNKGWARLWSTNSWRPVSRPLTGPAGAVVAQSTSPDGHTLAIGSTDGTVRLYDMRTEQPLGAPLPAVPNTPVTPEFSPDGNYLFAITDAGRAFRWDVRPSSWARHACAIAGRTLTPAEWKTALPDRPYAPACTR